MGTVADTRLPTERRELIISLINQIIDADFQNLPKLNKKKRRKLLEAAFHAAYQKSFELEIIFLGNTIDITDEQEDTLREAIRNELKKGAGEPNTQTLTQWKEALRSVKGTTLSSKPLFERWRNKFMNAAPSDSSERMYYELFEKQFEMNYRYSVKKWEVNKDATFQMKKDYRKALKWTASWMVLVLVVYLMFSNLISIINFASNTLAKNNMFLIVATIAIIAGIAKSLVALYNTVYKRKKGAVQPESVLHYIRNIFTVFAIVVALYLIAKTLIRANPEIPSIPFTTVLVVEGIILAVGLIVASIKSLEYDTKNPQETWARHAETVLKMDQEMMRYLLKLDAYQQPEDESGTANDAEKKFMTAILKIMDENNTKFVHNMENKERSMTKVLGFLQIPNIPS